MAPSRTYFDHAATSWPRLPGVVEAMAAWEASGGASVGRGSHRSAVEAGRMVDSLRSTLASTIGGEANEVAFFANGTAANNYALAGLLRPGDHVVTTAAEHNSVLRPLKLLERQRGIRYNVVPVDSVGRVDPQRIAEAIGSRTRLVVVSSASNVTGAVQDLPAIGRVCREAGVIFMVDAAQSFGYLPLDARQIGIDVVASPGHKAAGGPPGTGLLYAARRLHTDWMPLWVGGTGQASESLEGDFAWQEVAESGNRNAAALAGWLAGIRYRERTDGKADRDEWRGQLRRLVDLLREAPFGRVIGHEVASNDLDGYVPVVSLDCSSSAAGMDAAEWAALLDASFGIEVRAGLHCAALIHGSIGTTAAGGTLRFSVGHTTRDADLDTLQAAIEQLNAAFPAVATSAARR